MQTLGNIIDVVGILSILYHFDLRFVTGHSREKWALLKFATNQKRIFRPSRRPKITKLMNLRSKWYYSIHMCQNVGKIHAFMGL
jgi:hypothetical protein